MKKISCQTSTINPSLILRENPINIISTLRNLQLIEEHGHTHIIRNPHNEKNIMSNVNNQPLIDFTRKTINNISTLRNLQLIEEHGHTHIIRNPHNEKNIMSNVNNQPLIDFRRKPHQQHIYTQKPTTHRRTWSYAHYTKPSQ